ncbi:hypothetical protein [Maliponia aquimaris]|uniref:Uncharacterized protein n=1 Tax=Maliponia aquimaris TaxID=1673631 RepID=A0A238KXG7_9RHOB|nr:hypothetical protein [Maliponia aquimaris]SMX46756.1 hypothetical protein MAA8898_03514 [Maliponia aquimaris]
MDRLSLFLTLMSGSTITGTLIVTFFSFGWYNWIAIGTAAVIGFALAWPSARIISKRIKTRDPLYKVHKKDGLMPDPNGPEI